MQRSAIVVQKYLCRPLHGSLEKSMKTVRQPSNLILEAKMTFTDWLRQQTKRDDPIGDLAQDCATDVHWPLSGKYDDYFNYLNKHNAHGAVVAVFWDAWKEYTEEGHL